MPLSSAHHVAFCHGKPTTVPSRVYYWCLGKVLFSSINRKNLSLAQDTGKVIFKVDMLHKFDLKESRNFSVNSHKESKLCDTPSILPFCLLDIKTAHVPKQFMLAER